jgi:hypothetical protein
MRPGEKRIQMCVAAMGKDGVVRYSNYTKPKAFPVMCSACHEIYSEPLVPKEYEDDYVCKACEEKSARTEIFERN